MSVTTEASVCWISSRKSAPCQVCLVRWNLVKVEMYKFFKLSQDLTLVKWSRGHLALRLEVFQAKSVPCLFWCPWFFFKRRYYELNLSRDLTWPLYEGSWELMGGSSSRYVTSPINLVTIDAVMRCFKFVTWLHLTTGFRKSRPCHGVYRSSASGDLKYLICLLVS